MTLKRIPNTSRFVAIPRNSGDHEFNMSDYSDIDPAVAQEDIVVVGNWSDYSGSGAPTMNANLQGIANENQFDLDMKTEGVRSTEFGDRGARVATHRQRGKIVTIESSK